MNHFLLVRGVTQFPLLVKKWMPCGSSISFSVAFYGYLPVIEFKTFDPTFMIQLLDWKVVFQCLKKLEKGGLKYF